MEVGPLRRAGTRVVPLGKEAILGSIAYLAQTRSHGAKEGTEIQNGAVTTARTITTGQYAKVIWMTIFFQNCMNLRSGDMASQIACCSSYSSATSSAYTSFCASNISTRGEDNENHFLSVAIIADDSHCQKCRFEDSIHSANGNPSGLTSARTSNHYDSLTCTDLCANHINLGKYQAGEGDSCAALCSRIDDNSVICQNYQS